jgi:predicted permease
MRRRFRRLFRHPPLRDDQLARELDEEIASHLAARAEQLELLGMTPNEARDEARRRFGDLATAQQRLAQIAAHRGERVRAHERSEEIRTLTTGLSHDVRLAARTLRLHPTFAVAVVATLGLAIAAAVTAFSFVDAIFLRPLPVPNADKLVHVYLPRRDGRLTPVGSAGAALLRDRRDVFESIAAHSCCWVKFVRERGNLDQRYVAFVSWEFFPMLGLEPRLGRFFTAQETATPGAEPVVVISHTLWQRVFAGDPHAIGEHIATTGRDFTIIGIAPEGFDGIGIGSTRSEIWLPTTMAAAVGIRCTPAVPCDDGVDALARLRPGVSVARAQAGLANLGAELSRVAIGDDSVRQPAIVRASGASVEIQNAYSPLARLLGAIAALLLLIACANLSGLLIVRGVARSREIALRLSLGAQRIRVARQLLVESGLLAILGGALGVALSIWTSRQLMSFFISDSEGFETYFHVGLDARILWFALGVSLASTLVFGLLPALVGTRAQPADVLKSGGAGSGRARVRFELIAVQVGLTTVLLSGAVLLSRSFSHLLHAQRFDVDHVALFRVRPAAAQYDTLRSEEYVRSVAQRVASLPGVERVAYARGAGFTWGKSPIEVGVGASVGDTTQRVDAHFISPEFFKTLEIHLLGGREFSNSDIASTQPVAILDAPLVQRLFGGASALGKTLYAGGKAFRIIGVVPDYRVGAAHEGALPMAFFAFRQNALGPERDARFAVRVRGDPSRMLGVLRESVHDIDRAVPIAEFMTLARQVDASYPQIRLGQNVLLASAGLALFLSAIGLYGMIAFLVTRRTRDIGLRIALGALPIRVAGQLVGGGMRATAIGVVAGLLGAWSLSHLLSTWLVGVTPHDALAYVLAALAVMLAALVACAIPAARAAAIDPAIALRVE